MIKSSPFMFLEDFGVGDILDIFAKNCALFVSFTSADHLLLIYEMIWI